MCRLLKTGRLLLLAVGTGDTGLWTGNGACYLIKRVYYLPHGGRRRTAAVLSSSRMMSVGQDVKSFRVASPKDTRAPPTLPSLPSPLSRENFQVLGNRRNLEPFL